MPRSVYEVGTLVRAMGTFAVEDVLTDPTTVTATIRDAAGAATVYVYLTDVELVRDAEGIYHVDIDADAAGRWVYRFVGTGAAQAAGERLFLVEESGV